MAVTYVAVSAVYAPLWAAAERGLFAKHGLDVSLSYRNPTAGVQAMIAGDAAVYAGGTAALEAALGGAEIVYVGTILDRFVLSVFSRPEIKDLGGLRGRRLGVTRPGTPTYAGAQFLLRRSGLIREKDVELVYLDAGPEVLAALEQGTIDAAMLNPPLTGAARRAGFHELEDLGQLPARFPQASFVVRRAILDAHPERLARLLQGYVAGVRFCRERPAEAAATIARHTDVGDPEVSRESYHAFAPWWEVPPAPAAVGIRTALSLSTHPRARTARAEEFVDDRIIDALERPVTTRRRGAWRAVRRASARSDEPGPA